MAEQGTPAADDDVSAPSLVAVPPQKHYMASLGPDGSGPHPIPTEFAESVLALEKTLGMPLWMFVQDGSDHSLCEHIEEAFFQARHELPRDEPIALLLESPGGSASAAYRIAKMLQRRCGEFTVVVASWAKSAATLLSLGASKIILAEHAQLGPLDAQLTDFEREATTSALDETQAVERLHSVALETLDMTVFLLGQRSKKKLDTVLPHAMKFTTDLMRPLLEKVDVVQYTSRQRTLKVAEEYAVRLLRQNYTDEKAEEIARNLVVSYPDHGFVIDFEEAEDLGLPVVAPTLEQSQQLDRMLLHLQGMNAFGRVVEK